METAKENMSQEERIANREASLRGEKSCKRKMRSKVAREG